VFCTVEFGLFIYDFFLSASKLNVTSQRPRNIGRKYEVVAKRGLKLRRKQTEA